jgi:hypothetical protein
VIKDVLPVFSIRKEMRKKKEGRSRRTKIKQHTTTRSGLRTYGEELGEKIRERDRGGRTIPNKNNSNILFHCRSIINFQLLLD